MELDRPIGERIAIYRRRRGITQAVLAGLVGRSESWLSQVERGTRAVDRLSVLIDIAKVLKVDVATLSGQPFTLGPNGGPEYDHAAAIRAALTDYRTVALGQPATQVVAEPDLSALGEAATEFQMLYQAAHYAQVGAMAPLLIRHGQDAVASSDGDDHRRALTVLAVVYGATAALLSRVGETDLAWIAADRSVSTAQQAGDAELVTVGLYRLAQAFLRAGRVDDAYRVATTAAGTAGLSGYNSPAATSLQGALTLTAAIAAARHDDRRENLQLIRRAEDLASTLGEDRNDHYTAFGPTNVRIHATSSAVELGDASEAIRQGETVDTSRLPEGLHGRRSQVHIDLAWAYGQRRNDPATVLSLLEAERIAPEVLRYNITCRELLRECLRREKRSTVPGLRGLAQRAGIAS